jgi:hypothetical protein
LLDEFANIGQIPEFTKKLATMRKYDISCTVILQNLAQIKTMYKDDWESIVGNCDSFLFLGGSEATTLEYISKKLGKETIRVKSRGTSIGKNKSGNVNINRSGRELMTPDELSNMSNDECVLMIRGLHPFYDKKYDYVKHPNYPKTGDADKSLLYINKRNNREPIPENQLAAEYEKTKAKLYAKSEASKNPNDKIIGEPVKPNVLASELNIDLNKPLSQSVTITGPEDIKEIKKPKKELLNNNEPFNKNGNKGENKANTQHNKDKDFSQSKKDDIVKESSFAKEANSDSSSDDAEVWTF